MLSFYWQCIINWYLFRSVGEVLCFEKHGFSTIALFFFIKDTYSCKQWHDFCTQTSLFHFFLFIATSCNMFFCYRFSSSAWLICSLFKGSLIAQVLDISSFNAENSSMIWKKHNSSKNPQDGNGFSYFQRWLFRYDILPFPKAMGIELA